MRCGWTWITGCTLTSPFFASALTISNSRAKNDDWKRLFQLENHSTQKRLLDEASIKKASSAAVTSSFLPDPGWPHLTCSPRSPRRMDRKSHYTLLVQAASLHLRCRMGRTNTQNEDFNVCDAQVHSHQTVLVLMRCTQSSTLAADNECQQQISPCTDAKGSTASMLIERLVMITIMSGVRDIFRKKSCSF